MNELQKKNDTELWQTIRNIAKEHGYTLPDRTPDEKTLKQIRDVLSGNGNFSYGDAIRILSSYKKGGR